MMPSFARVRIGWLLAMTGGSGAGDGDAGDGALLSEVVAVKGGLVTAEGKE